MVFLLFAANWMLPAQLPTPLAAPDTLRPSIRILSDIKAPERVVMDTNAPLPLPGDQEIIAAGLGPNRLDAPEKAQSEGSPPSDSKAADTFDGPLTPTIRDSLAQSIPAPTSAARAVKSQASQRSAHVRSGMRRRFARRSPPRDTPKSCKAANGNLCGEALALNRLW
ncbi:hypothetical protein [Bradyrhizobium agreste]|uniref:hypothetical protein n=1 Tax=Bradyrhizobium agreste TaxID=2751811 RepID=UPI0018D77AEB|nr:hypothetical protein [Bradyrhizobium agreste]